MSTDTTTQHPDPASSAEQNQGVQGGIAKDSENSAAVQAADATHENQVAMGTKVIGSPVNEGGTSGLGHLSEDDRRKGPGYEDSHPR
jgi:hypothetical protein